MTKLKSKNLDAALKMDMAQPFQFSEMAEIVEANWPQRPDLKPRTMREEAMLNCLLLVIEKQAMRLQQWSEQLVKLAKMDWPPPRPFNEVLEIHHDGETVSQFGFVADAAVKIFAGGTYNADEAMSEAMELWEALAKKYPDGCARQWEDEESDDERGSTP